MIFPQTPTSQYGAVQVLPHGNSPGTSMSPKAHAPQITEPLQSECSEQILEDVSELSPLLDSEDGGTREVEASLEFSLVLAPEDELEVSEHKSSGQPKPAPETRVQTLLIQSTISHVFKQMILEVS